jgi:phage terminase large subunit-like protein
MQPFVNYNLPEGWYLTSSPIITANWNATSGDKWNFPLGGGVGKILKIGDQPINVGFYIGRLCRDRLGPTRLIRELIADPTVALTRGSTYENEANLAGAFVAQIVKKYEGSRLGRQELNAEVLDDVPGALWTRALIEAARPRLGFQMPDLVRVVVAIDPAASSGEDADETGIVVAGKDKDSRGYVLADLSGHYTPIEWARIAVKAYHDHGADRVVAEINNGGEMVEATLRVVDDNIAYTGVHATRGKVLIDTTGRRPATARAGL